MYFLGFLQWFENSDLLCFQEAIQSWRKLFFDQKLILGDEIFKTFGVPKPVEKFCCCICFETEGNDLYLLEVCSHMVCWKCFRTYFTSKGLKGTFKVLGNKLEILLDLVSKLPCPKCRSETVSGIRISLIKIFF